MDPAEVIKTEPQHDRRTVVLELFAENVREPRKAARTHTNTEVLAFDVRRADAFGIRASDAWDHFGGNNFGRGIPPLAFGAGAIDLDKLRKIHTIIKRV